MALNTTLAVVLLIAVALLWSFSQRVSSPRPDPERLENPGNLLGSIIQLEVRNGTNEAELAARMSEYLRDLGFDVVDTGNYTSQSIRETAILDRIGNRDAAEQVALALGMETDRISEELELTWYLDATIVLGADYATIKPFVDLLDSPVEEDSSEEDSGE